MTNRNVPTKRAIWASGLSIILCLAMLAGTTFAWFSDVASNKGNRIQAGNLGITVIGYEEDGGVIGDFKNPQTPALINESNWESGFRNTKYIEIKNSGTLHLKFELTFVTSDGGLQPALWYDINAVGTLPDNTVTPAREPMSSLASDVQMGTLSAGATVVYRVDYGMLESAGDTYMDKSFSADIIVTATQTNAAAAVKKVFSAADLTLAGGGITPTFTLMKDIVLMEELVLDGYCNLDLNGFTITGDVTFDIPSGFGTIDISGGAITGTLTVNTPGGTVNAYGSYGSIHIIAVAPHTFHFYGSAGSLWIQEGRTMIHKGAAVTSLRTDPDAELFLHQDVNINHSAIQGEFILVDEGGEQVVVRVMPDDDIVRKFSNAKSGSAVVIAEGTYVTDSVITIADKNLLIRGEGEVVIKKSDSGTFSDSNRQVMTITGNAQGANCVIENITLDANNRRSTENKASIPLNIISANVIIRNVKALNAPGFGACVVVNAKYHDTTVTAYGLITKSMYGVDVTGGTTTTATFRYEKLSCVCNGINQSGTRVVEAF